MTNKILLLGSSGQLGYELKRVLPFFGNVLSICKSEFDYLNFTELANYVGREKPKFIVNASAYTHVDKAENDTVNAFHLNAELPGQLATLAKVHHCSLVHYSTDYVFNGQANQPYIETDAVDPLGVYGKSKLEGEMRISESGCDFIILRTAWLYGHFGSNFYKRMIELAQEKEVLRLVNDQIGCPTSARTVAFLTALVLQNSLNGFKEKSGVYHLVSSGRCSWYDFAKLIIEQAVPSIQRKVKEILPIPSDQYMTIAKRPSYSVLSTGKFQKTFGVLIPDWQEIFLKHIEDREWAALDE